MREEEWTRRAVRGAVVRVPPITMQEKVRKSAKAILIKLSWGRESGHLISSGSVHAI